MLMRIAQNVVRGFAHYLQQMIDQEAARGDTLSYDAYLKMLLMGQRFILAAYADEDDPTPVILLFCSETVDHFRGGRKVFCVQNVLVPDRDKLRTVGTERMRALRDEVNAAFAPYAYVCFFSDNPALPKFLERVGLTIRIRQTEYEIIQPTPKALPGA